MRHTRTAVAVLTCLVLTAATLPRASHAQRQPGPTTNDTLVYAGAGTLIGGWLLGLVPLMLATCQQEDSMGQCQERAAFGDALDYEPAWGLLPLAGPFVIIGQSNEAITHGFFAVAGAAQVIGLGVLIAGATLRAEERAAADSPVIDWASPTLLTDGVQQGYGVSLSGRF